MPTISLNSLVISIAHAHLISKLACAVAHATVTAASRGDTILGQPPPPPEATLRYELHVGASGDDGGGRAQHRQVDDGGPIRIAIGESKDLSICIWSRGKLGSI